jgi:hypothetical protein
MKALIEVIERRMLSYLWIMNEISKDVEVINVIYLRVTNDRGKRRRFSFKIAGVREVRN